MTRMMMCAPSSSAREAELMLGNFRAAHNAMQQTIAGLTQHLQQQAMLPMSRQQDMQTMMQQMNLMQQKPPTQGGRTGDNNAIRC